MKNEDKNKLYTETDDVDVEIDTEELLEGLHELLTGMHHCMDAISAEADEEEPVLMVAAQPGKPIQIVTEEECFKLLPVFGDCDFIGRAPGLDLLMSYDPRHMVELDSTRYLLGPVIFYDADEDGEAISLTAHEIYAVRLLVEKHTVTLCADGKDVPALRLG